ncbi:hypothetical protein BDV28DRAFT_158632 [Aspergillus coremiiformis]|uniref:Uncharacterized protein n=1 Tax=Aspergillus coremiiformis TaxID=138285 RepID=A0A5N6Z1P8_9EURO|nr:hypothetical protein BDV28DRAFT_158632 [Aspergillus coremiiformis]
MMLPLHLIISIILAFFFSLILHRFCDTAMEKQVNEELKKKRPTPSPGAETSGSNKTKCERQDDNDDEEVFIMDDFPTEILLETHCIVTKQASLEKPFEMLGSDANLTDAIQGRVNTHSPPSDRENVTGTPLSDDDITNILNDIKPECHKAEAWIKAHEASKAVKERGKVKLENRDDLRKKAVRQSHDRARQAASQSDVSSHDARAPGLASALGGPGNHTVQEELEEARVVYNRVSLAHDRLLKTIADMEDFRKTMS